MALTTFYGWTQNELLAALRDAQEDYAKGKTIISTGSGDVNAAKQVQASALERIQELQRALYELDSEVYATFATVGFNQTVARFS